MYFISGEKYDKFSSKGINKNTNDITIESFKNVLHTKENTTATNRGFRMVNNRIMSYLQEKKRVTYFYDKRKVLEDGISTEPLDI